MTTTSGTEAPDAPAPVLERPDWASTGDLAGGQSSLFGEGMAVLSTCIGYWWETGRCIDGCRGAILIW